MPLAYCFTAYGGPETQVLLDLPTPQPGPGQLLVQVRAAGVDPADWKVRSGLRKATVPVTFPAILGREVAGTVTATGEGVTGFEPGDDVFGAADGGYAEYTLVDAASAAHKPEGVSFADASTLPVAAGTAYDALDQMKVAADTTLVVIGAGGGVGTAALQIARSRGARVLGIASESKAAVVRELGALWLDRGTVPRERVDAILDLVGGDTLRSVAAALAPDGRLISVADPSTATALGGSGVTRRRTSDAFAALAALVESGVLDPRVGLRFPLARAGEALAAVEDGHAAGKVVLEIGCG
ncbi:NADPH:quinone reductase [Rhodococcoides trifolii]|uniref:NADPH:quinone reductase n=1 Tax=Rhodococcoides trifolii TaxID=908250 RepID=A0A917CZD2_9NOCA|nr:NADPH:quinone reductase [Rhodococcus trifolii]